MNCITAEDAEARRVAEDCSSCCVNCELLNHGDTETQRGTEDGLWTPLGTPPGHEGPESRE